MLLSVRLGFLAAVVLLAHPAQAEMDWGSKCDNACLRIQPELERMVPTPGAGWNRDQSWFKGWETKRTGDGSDKDTGYVFCRCTQKARFTQPNDKKKTYKYTAAYSCLARSKDSTKRQDNTAPPTDNVAELAIASCDQTSMKALLPKQRLAPTNASNFVGEAEQKIQTMNAKVSELTNELSKPLPSADQAARRESVANAIVQDAKNIGESAKASLAAAQGEITQMKATTPPPSNLGTVESRYKAATARLGEVNSRLSQAAGTISSKVAASKESARTRSAAVGKSAIEGEFERASAAEKSAKIDKSVKEVDSKLKAEAVATKEESSAKVRTLTAEGASPRDITLESYRNLKADQLDKSADQMKQEYESLRRSPDSQKYAKLELDLQNKSAEARELRGADTQKLAALYENDNTRVGGASIQQAVNKSMGGKALSPDQIRAQEGILARQDEAGKTSGQTSGGATGGTTTQLQKDYSRSNLKVNDPCSTSVMSLLVEDAVQRGARTREEVIQKIEEGGLKTQYEKKYGCKAAKRDLELGDNLAMATKMALQVGSQVGSARAQYNVQEFDRKMSKEDPYAVHKKAAEEMRDAETLNATSQTAAAVAHGYLAMKAGKIQSRQENAAQEVDAIKGVGIPQDRDGSTGLQHTYSGMAMAVKTTPGTSDMNTAQLNAEGETNVEEDASRYEELASQAKQQKTANMWQAALMAVEAGKSAMRAHILNLQAKEAGPFKPLPSPGVDGTPNDAPGDATPPMSLGDTNATADGTAFTAEEKKEDPTTPLDPIAPFGGGGGNPGGLKDAPMLGDGGGMVGPGSTSGGGGGSGGGFGGGGGGGSDGKGEGEDKGTALVTGGPVGFSNGAAAGAVGPMGFGKDSKGGRVGNTGDMDFNQLMAALMGKKDGREPAGVAGNKVVGKGMPGGAGYDDNSILGKNTNLFIRISDSMTSNFKRGNIR